MNCEKEKIVRVGLRSTLLDARAQLSMVGRKLALLERVAADGGSAPARVFAQLQLECMARRAADMEQDMRAAYSVIEDEYCDTVRKARKCATNALETAMDESEFTNSGKESGCKKCGAIGLVGTA